ncbi:hypothetical protein M885DRAFT_525178 [Pelagophyceae sp. CCMP2097]|nr:hypothetical protein M885DRAFT_525178 [Pelagophyceae sp. CCMP2097]
MTRLQRSRTCARSCSANCRRSARPSRSPKAAPREVEEREQTRALEFVSEARNTRDRPSSRVKRATLERAPSTGGPPSLRGRTQQPTPLGSRRSSPPSASDNRRR